MALLTPASARRFIRRLARGWLVAFLLTLTLPDARPAGQSAAVELSAEYRVKSGFLFNFPQFVEWPARAFRDAHAPIVIGILGDDPFGPYLDKLLEGEKVGGRSLVVQRFRRVEDAGNCQILFVSHSEAGNVEPLLTRLHDRAVLTVGEDESFERAGGMVRFVIENNKVRLRINPDAAKAHELTISSKLLRLATLVPARKP